MADQRLFVIAENFREYKNFCQVRNLRWGKDATFVENPGVFRGRKMFEVIRYGNYRQRPDIYEIEAMISELDNAGRINDLGVAR